MVMMRSAMPGMSILEKRASALSYSSDDGNPTNREPIEGRCLSTRSRQVWPQSGSQIPVLFDGTRTDDKDIHQSSGAWLPVGRGRNIGNAD
jgi:hypothetical protein